MDCFYINVRELGVLGLGEQLGPGEGGLALRASDTYKIVGCTGRVLLHYGISEFRGYQVCGDQRLGRVLVLEMRVSVRRVYG